MVSPALKKELVGSSHFNAKSALRNKLNRASHQIRVKITYSLKKCKLIVTLQTFILFKGKQPENNCYEQHKYLPSLKVEPLFCVCSFPFNKLTLRSSYTTNKSLTWLQKQQLKLKERREVQLREERHPHETRLLSELRHVQSRHMKPTASHRLDG